MTFLLTQLTAQTTGEQDLQITKTVTVHKDTRLDQDLPPSHVGSESRR